MGMPAASTDDQRSEGGLIYPQLLTLNKAKRNSSNATDSIVFWKQDSWPLFHLEAAFQFVPLLFPAKG